MASSPRYRLRLNGVEIEPAMPEFFVVETTRLDFVIRIPEVYGFRLVTWAPISAIGGFSKLLELVVVDGPDIITMKVSVVSYDIKTCEVVLRGWGYRETVKQYFGTFGKRGLVINDALRIK